MYIAILYVPTNLTSVRNIKIKYITYISTNQLTYLSKEVNLLFLLIQHITKIIMVFFFFATLFLFDIYD